MEDKKDVPEEQTDEYAYEQQMAQADQESGSEVDYPQDQESAEEQVDPESPTPAEAIPEVQSQSMIEEEEEQKGWFAGILGALLCILLVGPILGLFLWWVWGRSPLVTWLKVGISLLPIVILFIVL